MLQKLAGKIKPIVADMGCALWGIEYLSSANPPVLRIYIDAAKGINVDQCAWVSREVSGILDVENPITGVYNLEVSSPGLDRRFFYPDQYKDYIGKMLKIKLNKPLEGSSRWRVTLTAVNDQEIEFTDGVQTYKVAFNSIEKARLMPS